MIFGLDFTYSFPYAFIMKTISITKARANLYKLMEWVFSSHRPVQITGKKGNAVLVSEEDWSAIQETLYLSSIPGMADSIKKGMKTSEKECSEELDW